MKIKHWLMSTYLLVMLLPVAAISGLYYVVSEYDQRQDIREYFQISDRIAEIEKALQDTSLYQIHPRSHYEALQSHLQPSVKIELYRYDGITLFTSNENGMQFGLSRVPPDKIYQDLYELRKSSQTYSIKKPVFADGRMIGIYQITLAREEWLTEVKNRTVWLASASIAFFLLLYVAVVWMLNRKLNLPLKRLMDRMTAFAENKPIPLLEHRSTDEIGELIKHFEDMRLKMELAHQEVLAGQKEKEYLVAALAHDVKTPLTSIRAYAEALFEQEGLTDKEQKEYRSVLFEKIDYMKEILNDLTIYTALRSSVRETTLTEVDGEEFFEMLFAGYEELCFGKGVQLHTEVIVSHELQVNARYLMRLVDNLFHNALGHTKEGQSIWLAAVSPRESMPDWVFDSFRSEIEKLGQQDLLLIVQNQGEAIPVELQQRVFEPFFQVDAARTKKGATSIGLGLSIAKMIMDEHDGSIHVWSANPYGTTFVCTLKVEERGMLRDEGI